MTDVIPIGSEGHVQRTSKHIAYGLIALFSICLVLILLAGIWSGEPSEWREIFKEGFLFLGGALTTVIGYYFGSKGTQEAEASAAIAQREAERAKKEAEEEKMKLAKYQEDEAPTYDEQSLDEPVMLDEEPIE
ncbi:MAG: hypothetical protein RPU60_02800 [Candidatus Sedimenticola sp. (ex Thyasira tokunagai)]